MAEAKSQDPVEHLPDAFAKLESMIADKIAAELAPARTRIAELERVAKSTSIITWQLNREPATLASWHAALLFNASLM
jgi:hypothetical protein